MTLVLKNVPPVSATSCKRADNDTVMITGVGEPNIPTGLGGTGNTV